MSDYQSGNQPVSDFFKFCENLRGFDLYYNNNRLYKWQVFNMTMDENIRRSISRRENKNFKYVEREGWSNGYLRYSV